MTGGASMIGRQGLGVHCVGEAQYSLVGGCHSVRPTGYIGIWDQVSLFTLGIWLLWSLDVASDELSLIDNG